MNTTLATATTATLSLSQSITLPTSVPSGYARQAQLEAGLANGFRAYDAQGAK